MVIPIDLDAGFFAEHAQQTNKQQPETKKHASDQQGVFVLMKAMGDALCCCSWSRKKLTSKSQIVEVAGPYDCATDMNN